MNICRRQVIGNIFLCTLLGVSYSSFLFWVAVISALEVGYKLEAVSQQPYVDFGGGLLQCEVDG
jgi:hypothetical protein